MAGDSLITIDFLLHTPWLQLAFDDFPDLSVSIGIFLEAEPFLLNKVLYVLLGGWG